MKIQMDKRKIDFCSHYCFTVFVDDKISRRTAIYSAVSSSSNSWLLIRRMR